MQKTDLGELGQKLGVLRYRSELSQKDVSKFCGVASVTVRNWENAKFRPVLSNLKKLIELYMRENAFLSGTERTEALKLWKLVDPAIVFDEEWFVSLIERLHPHVSAEAISLPFADPLLSEEGGAVQILASGSHFGHMDQLLQDRARMLDKMYNLWIKGYLEPMLAEFGPIPVLLRAMPSVVDYPFRALQRELKPTLNRSIPSIVDMFDISHEKLLILSEYEREKTIVLLMLVQSVLKRARVNERYPIPILFHLSSWPERRLPISAWLIEELSMKYQISRALSQTWIAQKQIFPLIDGLDEVCLEYRAECIESINSFLQDNGLIPTVVCSRSAYYLEQPQQFLLDSAVFVQPPELLC